MIAYILDGVGPQAGAMDKRMTRLRSAGPWQYQMHTTGALATWRASGPVPRTEFGEPRKTEDGLTYLPPRVLPAPEALLREPFITRTDLSDVVVNQEQGTTLRILPAYLSPRQILDDNTMGEFATMYGKAVRKLLDRIATEPETKYRDIVVELAECCRIGISYTYRVTRELITDLGWLNEESLVPLWKAMIQAPKILPASASGN